MGEIDFDKEGRSWWRAEEGSWTRKLLVKFLKLYGPIPQHIAIVMDGNRRFAREHGLGKVIRGHERGFSQLQKMLCWCNDIGVKELTVYAFSIENFKRSADEVDSLMTLAEAQFRKLLDEDKELDEHQVSFRFWGRLELLPLNIRQLVVQIERKTAKYSRAVMNICLAYTARDEVVRAAEVLRNASQKGLLTEEEVDLPLVRECMDSRRSRDPDLVIRTSGEYRCHIYFSKVLWPEFEHRHLCQAIFDYQRNFSEVQAIPRFEPQALEQASPELHAFINAALAARFDKLLCAEA